MTKKVREIVKILNRNGFIKIDQNGSPMKFYNPFTNRTVIVTNHRKDIPIGTEKSIWKQAGIKQ